MARRVPEVMYRKLIRVRNPAGAITEEALEGISEAFEEKDEVPVRVLVEGEEDLLVVPAVASAPLSSNLYYGQPLVGVVLIKVDGAAKKRNDEVLRELGIRN